MQYFKDRDLNLIKEETDYIKDYYVRAALSREIYIGFKEDQFIRMQADLEKEFMNKYRNLEYCSNSKPEFKGVDLKPIMEKIAFSNYEHFVVVLVDTENKKIYKTKDTAPGTITTASTKQNYDMYKFIVENIDDILEKELSIVTIHNHPFHVPAIVNENDKINWQINAVFASRLGVESYGDDFIVTPYDIYSNVQNNPMVKYDIIIDFFKKLKNNKV